MTWQWNQDHGWVGMLMGGMVDLTLTDPPYAQYVYENSRRTRTGAHEAHDLEHTWLTDAQIELACMAIAMRTTQHAIVFNDIEVGIPRWRAGLERYGMRYMGTGIWHKEPYTPQMTGDRGAQNYEAYLIMHAPGRSKWNGGGHGTCFKFAPAASANGRHPTEKPIPMLEYLIRMYSNRGDTVADPFGGRASTLVAAIRCGRNARGWEISDKHFANGKTRLESTREGVQMFSDKEMLEWYGRELFVGGKTQKLFDDNQLAQPEESA